ncbi:MAG: hypothetical protein ABEJ40_10690 [Haloarculaceae archaeon]
MQNARDVSAAELRSELSPVSERFVSFALGDALVVFDHDSEDDDRWLLSDLAYDRETLR